MPTIRLSIGVVVASIASCERVEPPVSVVVPPTSEPAPAIRTAIATRNAPPPPAPIPLRPRSNLTRWFVALSHAQKQDVAVICHERKLDPCAGMLPGPRKLDGNAVTDPDDRVNVNTLFAKFPDDDHEQIDMYCRKVAHADVCDTPLVVAFEAQPIAFTHASPSATFAFAPGEPAATDWPTAQTPWIAFDRDGDGAITTGVELFGDSTLLGDGSKARNGFAALAALDANRDGVIDRDDPAFASLLLWADRDGNHASSPDELQPLASRIIAIPLANRVELRCTDRHACEGERGTLRWRDASGDERVGAVVDVYLPRR